MFRSIKFWMVLVLLAAGLPAAGQAGPRHGRGVPLDEAVESVREETGGRILGAETSSGDDSRVHRIKVLRPDGRVQVRRIDAGGQGRDR